MAAAGIRSSEQLQVRRTDTHFAWEEEDGDWVFYEKFKVQRKSGHNNLESDFVISTHFSHPHTHSPDAFTRENLQKMVTNVKSQLQFSPINQTIGSFDEFSFKKTMKKNLLDRKCDFFPRECDFVREDYAKKLFSEEREVGG